MATLETIRTKAGVFISIIIGIALLSFIVNADTLATATSIFSSKNDVGKISDKLISLKDFDSEVQYYTYIYQLMSQGRGMDDAAQDDIRNQAWNAFLRKMVFGTEYENLGITVSDAELTELLTQNARITQMFTDPKTGVFQPDAMVNAINNLDRDPAWKAYWLFLESQTKDSQLMDKLATLTAKSIYVNNLDAQRAFNNAKLNSTFTYLAKDYSSLADTSVIISKSDIEKFYNKYKEMYDQARARDFDYISIQIRPQAIDYERTLAELTKLKAQMDTVPNSEIVQFAGYASEVPVDDTYYKKGELPVEVDSLAFVSTIGKSFPYYQIGDTYYASRIADIRVLPDSVRAEQILLNAETYMLADSIMDLLNKGANFADLAKQFSSDERTSETGGDIGWFSFSKDLRPFSDSCFLNPKGKLMKVGSRAGLHIVRVTGTKNENKKIQMATIQLTASAGKETLQDNFNQISSIAHASKNNAQAFRKLAADNGLQVRREYNVQLGTKRVAGFSDARELVRWLYDAKVDDVSNVFNIDNNGAYVVACLTKIKNMGIAPLEQVKEDVERRVRKEKKAELFAKQIEEAKVAGANNIDDFAAKLNTRAVSVSSGVNFNTSYIQGMRVAEPKLVGALSAASENVLAGPIQGENSVYLFVLTGTTPNPQITNVEAEKQRLQASKANQRNDFYNVFIEKAKIIDNRGKFF